MRLIDALSLLDLYARENAPVYERTELAERIQQTIQKAQSRARNGIKKIIPLEGQREFIAKADLQNAATRNNRRLF